MSKRKIQNTHCPVGHEYTPENTLRRTRASGREARECRACNIARGKKRTELIRAHTPRKMVLSNGTKHLTDAEYNELWIRHIESKITRDDNGCWLWQGRKTRSGHVVVNYRGSRVGLHRQMFMISRGVTLSKSELVCHDCPNGDVPNCCNPAHMFIGSHSDNIRDASKKGRLYGQDKTHCPHGHEYTPENTYLRPGVWHRVCRTCNRDRCRKVRAINAAMGAKEGE